MAIKVGQAFERTSAQPIDTTLALTKAQMKTVNDNLMPDYYFTICQEDGKIYLYDKSKASPSAITGKFDELIAGGGEDTPFAYHSDTPLLSEMNGHIIIDYADLERMDATHTPPTTADLIIGKTFVYDDKGSFGIVTDLDDTASQAVVTTATTSTPTKELTQAEYDALTEAEKNNGTIYFITDNYVGSTYVGAYDTIYSTTERVVGSYMGKPLYQKTFVKENVVLSGNGTTFINMGAGAENCKLVNSFGSRDELETIPYAWTSLDMIGFINETDNYFGIEAYRTGSGFTIPKIVMTYQYTKTTDTTSPVEYASPNDYSTSEKIVGTWIDGKPLYQKVVSCGTSIGTINHNIANIDKVVDASGVGFDATGGGYNIPFAGDNWIQCYGTRTRIDLQSKAASSWNLSGGIYITLKYTKTS